MHSAPNTQSQIIIAVSRREKRYRLKLVRPRSPYPRASMESALSMEDSRDQEIRIDAFLPACRKRILSGGFVSSTLPRPRHRCPMLISPYRARSSGM